MKKTLYITRHGETDYNKAHLVQGMGIDLDLNELGKAQGEAFCNYYKNIPFKKVYTSFLKRSWQTVEGFTKAGLPWVKLDGFNEVNFGEFEGKPIVSNPGDELFDVKTEWFKGNYQAKVNGGENPLEVTERQKKAMDVVLSEQEESPVLICMHGRALRIMLSWMLETEIKDMESYKTPNTCLYILEYDYSTSKFTCIEAVKVAHVSNAADI